MLKPGDPGYKIPEVPTKPEDIEYLKQMGCPHPGEACTRGCPYFENNTCPVA